jgi:hypothetical protein
MKKNPIDFFPQPHSTKQVFARHHIPVAAVARFLGLSTSYVCSLLTGFARVSPDNDKRLREFARLVEREIRGDKKNPTACLAQGICSPELGDGTSIARNNEARRPVSRGQRGGR